MADFVGNVLLSAWVFVSNLLYQSGLGPLLSQAQDEWGVFQEPATAAFQDPASAPDRGMLIVFWAICGLLIVIMHIFIAVWIFKDSQRKGKSGGGWAVFGAIPIIGLIGLLVYALSEGGSGGAGHCQIHQMPFAPGMQKCPVCIQLEAIAQKEREIERRLAEAEESKMGETQPVQGIIGQGWDPSEQGLGQMPGQRVDRTEQINLKPGVIISLQQIGGERHGWTTNLVMKDPFGQIIKSKIGRSAQCKISIPEDKSASSEHCVLSQAEDGSYYVADLDATNKTCVVRKGETIVVDRGREIIQDGDKLLVGNTKFRIIVSEPDEVTPPPQ